MEFNRILFASPPKDETNKSRNFEVFKKRIRCASFSSDSNIFVNNNNNSRLNNYNGSNNTNCKMVAAILQRKRDDLFATKSPPTTSSMFFAALAPKRSSLIMSDKRRSSTDLSLFVDLNCNTTTNKSIMGSGNNSSFFNRLFSSSKINNREKYENLKITSQGLFFLIKKTIFNILKKSL